jgi:hypothetical protein
LRRRRSRHAAETGSTGLLVSDFEFESQEEIFALPSSSGRPVHLVRRRLLEGHE